MMDVFYYFVKDFITGEQIIITAEKYLGDVNEMTIYGGKLYVIEDYAWEFYDTEDMREVMY